MRLRDYHLHLHQRCQNSLLGCLLLLFLLTTATTSLAQQAQHDTLHVQKLLELGQQQFSRDSLTAASRYFLQAEALSRKIGYHRGTAACLRNQILILDTEGKYQEALVLVLEAIEISKKVGQSDLAISYNYAGIVYIDLGDLEAAASYFLSALKISESLGDVKTLVKYSNNLAVVFAQLGEKEKYFHYANNSYQLALQLKDSLAMAYSLSNLAHSQFLLNKNDVDIKYIKEALHLAEKLQNSFLILEFYLSLGDIELERKNYQAALSYYQQGLQVLHYYPLPRIEISMYRGLSKAYYHMGMPDQAQYYLNKGIDIAKRINVSIQLKDLYELGAQIHEERKEPQLALNYIKKYQQLHDSLLNTQTQQNIHRMEIEFQTAQKEKEITKQKLLLAKNQLEIEKKNNLIYLSLIAVVVLLSGIIIFYMRYRDRQKANAQRLQALRQESELKVLMAMIEGEEKERSRLARELHDGVGGILSATRMHLSVLQNELDWAGQAQKFDHTSSMLDAASREVRTIAHNLSPDMLLRHELDQALASFCKSVSNSSLQVDFYYLGESVRLRSNFKLVLYRMVQELVNNIIKHAAATQALVQLSYHDHMLSLTVEDNGVGFEMAEGKGIGLANLKARVKDMQGEMSIESSPGRGTTVYAEFDITPFLEKDTIETTTA